MAPQVYDWTCSSCALDWVLVATGTRSSDRERTVKEIGYPDHINPRYGLVDGSGTSLQLVYDTYDLSTAAAWLDFDALHELARVTTGQMAGSAWYHWVGLRGVSGADLWIANSAPGYRGVWDILSRADFNRLGPFRVVWLD